jgi:tetratricopeptide (TPR) repeat protein
LLKSENSSDKRLEHMLALARLYEMVSNYEDSLEYANFALQIDSENYEALFLKAQSLAYLSQIDEAKEIAKILE